MNPTQQRPRSAMLFLGTALFLFTSGCGVTEYENRMAQEQARLDYIDKENQFLEGTIKWPEKKEEKKEEKTAEGLLPTDVFFRPPRGIVLTPQPAGGQVLRLPAAQALNQPTFREVFVMVAKNKGRDAFRAEALKNFSVAGSGTEKILNVPGRKPMAVEVYRTEQGSMQQYLYLYQEDAYLGAVAFRSDKPDLAAMDVSVGTLYFGPAADQQHWAFGKRRPAGK